MVDTISGIPPKNNQYNDSSVNRPNNVRPEDGERGIEDNQPASGESTKPDRGKPTQTDESEALLLQEQDQRADKGRQQVIRDNSPGVESYLLPNETEDRGSPEEDFPTQAEAEEDSNLVSDEGAGQPDADMDDDEPAQELDVSDPLDDEIDEWLELIDEDWTASGVDLEDGSYETDLADLSLEERQALIDEIQAEIDASKQAINDSITDFNENTTPVQRGVERIRSWFTDESVYSNHEEILADFAEMEAQQAELNQLLTTENLSDEQIARMHTLYQALTGEEGLDMATSAALEDNSYSTGFANTVGAGVEITANLVKNAGAIVAGVASGGTAAPILLGMGFFGGGANEALAQHANGEEIDWADIGLASTAESLSLGAFGGFGSFGGKFLTRYPVHIASQSLIGGSLGALTAWKNDEEDIWTPTLQSAAISGAFAIGGNLITDGILAGQYLFKQFSMPIHIYGVNTVDDAKALIPEPLNQVPEVVSNAPAVEAAEAAIPEPVASGISADDVEMAFNTVGASAAFATAGIYHPAILTYLSKMWSTFNKIADDAFANFVSRETTLAVQTHGTATGPIHGQEELAEEGLSGSEQVIDDALHTMDYQAGGDNHEERELHMLEEAENSQIRH